MSLPRFFKILGVLFFLVPAFSLPQISFAEARSHQAKVNIYKLASGNLALSIKGTLNRTLILRRRKSSIASSIFIDHGNGNKAELNERAVLYQGKLLQRLGRIDRVAAAVVGEKLSITFKTLRHKPKTFVIKIPLAEIESGVGSGFLFRAPTLRSKGCAETEAHPVEAVISDDGSNGSSGGAISSAAVYSPAKVLEIAAVADSYFFSSFGSDSPAKIQEVLNAAEVFYQNDIGENFDATITIRTSQFSSTYMGDLLGNGELIDEFATYVSNNSLMRDIAHLFTTHDYVALYGDTTVNAAGLANVGVICRNRPNSVGISEFINGVTHVITAHEIGHNHDASHASASPGTIMTASIDGTEDSFAGANISEMTSYIDSHGSCLAASDTSPGDGGGGSGPTPPAITLKSSIKPAKGSSKGYVKLSVTNPLSEDLSGCAVTLYGSSVKADLETSPPAGSSVVEIASFDGSELAASGAKVIFKSANLAKAPTKDKSVYFNYYIDCSEISGSGTAKKGKQGKWPKFSSILSFLKKVKNKAVMQ